MNAHERQLLAENDSSWLPTSCSTIKSMSRGHRCAAKQSSNEAGRLQRIYEGAYASDGEWFSSNVAYVALERFKECIFIIS